MKANRVTIITRLAGALLLFAAAGLASALVAGADVAPSTPRGTVAIDPSNGQADETPVWAVAEANGRYYIGGEFSEVGGEPQAFLAAIEVATGRLDPIWRPQVDGIINSMAISPDGSAVFVGGRFSSINGTTRSRIAKLDPVTGAVDATFNPGASAAVEALVTDGSSVWAGGFFLTIGGTPRERLARLDATTGVVDAAWSAPADASVLDLELDDGVLYVGGTFNSLGATGIAKLGSVEAATGTVRTWDPAETAKVYDVEVHPNGTIVYAGVGGSINSVRAFDATTAAFVWAGQTDGDIQALAVTDDAVYAGGHGNNAQSGAGGVSRNKLSAWDPLTGALDPWDPSADSVRGVWALAIGPSGLLAGGDFLNVGGVAQAHFAVFAGDGRGNRSPEARFTVSCTGQACAFDASGSNDPDGQVSSYSWDFGDGQQSTLESPTVTLADDSAHTVSLTVTDDLEAWSLSVNPVVVGSGGLDVELIGSHNVNQAGDRFSAILPAEATVNDVAFAFISLANASAIVTAPPGWELIDDQTVLTLRSQLWTKVLGPSDAGAFEHFDINSTVKADLTTLTFRGVDIDDPLAAYGAQLESLERAGHEAPALSFPGDATVVHHWLDRTSGTSQFTAAGGLAQVSSAVGIGGGAVSSVTAIDPTTATTTSSPAVAVANTHDLSAMGWSLALRALEPVVLNPIDGHVERVIHISIDGLRADAINSTDAPTLSTLIAEGTSTMNARNDSAFTITLPNHLSQLTGRAVSGPGGHGVTFDDDLGTTVHDAAGEYVASAFDVVHDNGGRTGAFVAKPKFLTVDRSWNAANGAPDTTGVDNGTDKIDVYYEGSTSAAAAELLTELSSNPPMYNFLHVRYPDLAGHTFNWGSAEYVQAVSDADAVVGLLRHAIATDPELAGTTAILVTTDHGGPLGGAAHGDPTDPQNYTIPFMYWGPTVPAGEDLYEQQIGVRTDPGTTQVPTDGGAWGEPIRGHDAGNVAMDLLGLPLIPKSQYRLGRDGFVALVAECLVYDSTSATATGLAGTMRGGNLRTVQVTGALTGQGGTASCVPVGAASAVFRISSIDPLTEGNLLMTPSGVTAAGSAGVVNYGAANGLDNANTVTVPVSVDGAVDIEANTGPFGAVPTTDVRLVVVGYYSPDVDPDLKYFSVNPCAVADSRTTQGASDGFDGPANDGLWPVGSGFPDIDLVGTFAAGQGGGNGAAGCGVPAGADAVMVNVVAVNMVGGSGHLSVGPGGTDPIEEATTPFAVLSPKMNNGATTIVNLGAGETIAIDIDGDGGASTMIRVEVLGYFDDDQTGFDFFDVTPCAAFDTRTNQGAAGSFGGERLHGLTHATTYQVAGDAIPVGQGGVVDGGEGFGSCDVPDDASAVLINLEAVNAIIEGNFWVSASGTTTTGGVLNFNNVVPKMNNANAVVVPLSPAGQLDLEINAGSFTPVGTSVAHARGVILGYYN